MKFTLGLVVGAAVGAAVVHYLNTSEGKALVNRVKNDAEDAGESLAGLADNLVSKGRSILGQQEEEEIVERIVVVGLNS